MKEKCFEIYCKGKTLYTSWYTSNENNIELLCLVLLGELLERVGEIDPETLHCKLELTAEDFTGIDIDKMHNLIDLIFNENSFLNVKKYMEEYIKDVENENTKLEKMLKIREGVIND